jgi:hypothetical protein
MVSVISAECVIFGILSLINSNFGISADQTPQVSIFLTLDLAARPCIQAQAGNLGFGFDRG